MIVEKALRISQSLLAEARKRRGWTQAHVAEKIGVSVETVRQWESNRHFPYQESIQRLCGLFDLPPEALGLLREQPAPLHLVQASEIRAGQTLGRMAREGAFQQMGEAHTLGQQMAWKICIELITRVPLVRRDDNGLLREALSSLYEQARTIRAVLADCGPLMAEDGEDTMASLCLLLLSLLNTTIRPLLTKWHPLLKDYEDTRPSLIGRQTYERQWERSAELRQEIEALKAPLRGYAITLARLAGTPWLQTAYFAEGNG
jgi:transcriptional regulator with XRE-family HTH domain